MVLVFHVVLPLCLLLDLSSLCSPTHTNTAAVKDTWLSQHLRTGQTVNMRNFLLFRQDAAEHQATTDVTDLHMVDTL